MLSEVNTNIHLRFIFKMDSTVQSRIQKQVPLPSFHASQVPTGYEGIKSTSFQIKFYLCKSRQVFNFPYLALFPTSPIQMETQHLVVQQSYHPAEPQAADACRMWQRPGEGSAPDKARGLYPAPHHLHHLHLNVQRYKSSASKL